jgi:NO-binding membrane sensor protein with MHYT domain
MVERLLPRSLIPLRASLDAGMTRVTWAMVALSPVAMLVAAWIQGRIVSRTRQQAGRDLRGWFKLSAFAFASSIAQVPMFLSLVAYLMGGRVAPAFIAALLSTVAVVGLWLLLERQL